LTAENFLRARAPLSTGHAVAALLVLEDGRYIMQLRDDLPDIWYPGHWGLFGGGVDEGEDEFKALQRELREELELEVTQARLFATIDYDLQPIGLDCYFRKYYEVPVTLTAWNRVVLHEGSEVRALRGEEALSLPRISPYDAFALFLHHNRNRLAGSIYAPGAR
jgi:8-oxo-dGTP pyrophosphatase MutT (NUDIX family)